MDGPRIARHVMWFSAAGLLMFPMPPAVASPLGQLGAAEVREESYRFYLDDKLYAHAGDNRAFSLKHDLAQANIVSLLSGFGLTVTLEPFIYASETYYNVVGTKLGTTYPDQEYLVTAHYDSVNCPGADDNASGVALVLEAARVLTAYDSEYTIRFIAFDREEQGLYGSQAYVQAHADDDIVWVVNADMVAYNTFADKVEIYGRSLSSTVKYALAEAVETYGEGLDATTYGDSDGSDHAPFEWAGIPACLIIERWGNPYYHGPNDNVDTPDYIDYDFATRITRSVVGLLVDHAGVQVDSATDCNRNGVLDTDEVAAGTAEDCNFNQILDECELQFGLRQDCNETGVPDDCEIWATFHSASPQLSPLGSGFPQSHTVSALPPAVTDVTLLFTGYGELGGGGTESIVVDINGTEVGVVFAEDAGDCSDPPDVDELIVSAETFNSIVDGGDAVINMIPASQWINWDECGPDDPTFITVTLTYRTEGVSTDCNDTGVPDECESGDADGDGELRLSDVAALSVCLSGPCPSPPCDPSLYADPCCVLSDFDGDGDHDLLDIAEFQAAFTGP